MCNDSQHFMNQATIHSTFPILVTTKIFALTHTKSSQANTLKHHILEKGFDDSYCVFRMQSESNHRQKCNHLQVR